MAGWTAGRGGGGGVVSKRSYIQRFGKQLANRDGWVCHYCVKPLVPLHVGKTDTRYRHVFAYEIMPDGTEWPVWETRPEYGEATVDHIICRIDGGSDDLDNLVLACWWCNTKRNVKPYEVFLQQKRAEVKA